MEKFDTKKLYIVRPSMVINDNTKLLKEDIKNNQAYYVHTINFSTNSKDIDFAFCEKHSNVYKSVFSDKCYFKGITKHTVEGDYYIGLNENDLVLLTKYLFERKTKITKWNKALEDYIISLKPYYSYEELKNILEELKFNISEDIVSTLYKKKYKGKIKGSWGKSKI